MSDYKYEARLSKGYFLFNLIGYSLFSILFIFIIYLGANMWIEEKKSATPHSGNLTGGIYLVFWGLLMLLLILFVIIYLIIAYKQTIDVYTEEKMYRIKRNKVVFEIDYKNIRTIRDGPFCSLFIFCKEGYIKRGWNKGATTFAEYYSKYDKHRVKQLIMDKYHRNFSNE